MLTRTFVHLPGVGPVKEKSLWARGIREWQDLASKAGELFREDKAQIIRDALANSHLRFGEKDYHFFYRKLPRPELWRLVPFCFDKIAYLDIETNGQAMPPQGYTTTIAIYFAGKLYQEHDRAKKAELLRFIEQEATAYCTFFGEVFDIPFLRAEFNLPFQKAHFDLCFWLKRHGYRGGLKKVEKLFPDIRSRDSHDIDGWDAVRLWQLHQRGTPGALETLQTYNAEDTMVLEPLLVKAYNLDVKLRPELGLTELIAPPQPKLLTRVDEAIFQRLKMPSL